MTLQSEDEEKCSLLTNESNQVNHHGRGKKKLMDDGDMGENSWKVITAEIKQATRNLFIESMKFCIAFSRNRSGKNRLGER